MSDFIRKLMALVLCELLAVTPLMQSAQNQPAGPARPSPVHAYLQKSYLELFELSPKLEFSSTEIGNERIALDNGKKVCVSRFKAHADRYQKQLDAAQKQLKAKSP